MHISEGILSAPVLIGSGLITVAGTALGLHKIDHERIMSVAILTSTFFVASLIHVPIGSGSIHLILNGLLGLILGWASFPAILIALFLQALFFQFGGIAVLGVNTLNAAVPAVICFYLFRPLLRRVKYSAVAGFGAGFFAVFLSAILVAVSLISSDTGFIDTAKVILIANIPLMLIEGIITGCIVTFLIKVQPEILGQGSNILSACNSKNKV
jgi:cobalt/nickel transport system permease protein